ncbi:uncharacterized protein ASCRUDRAFT_75511 [Ascoidea rubescens DSM 1968]|uniref:Uncharacterized protein n=1 Tax=Ascoidea rubescens DSM 1968 TaxID=1344418 RepID=A0A1D2VIQ8_9ASCO|nr:hypothetical protein ASCRUDRAFT_75511 [Ascoidea rubescens DSM 1968]ODV61512.1 hypothetical protein ASCRUDRAFT_75511 [Ascoidea rubescens DSM 1968]
MTLSPDNVQSSLSSTSNEPNSNSNSINSSDLLLSPSIIDLSSSSPSNINNPIILNNNNDSISNLNSNTNTNRVGVIFEDDESSAFDSNSYNSNNSKNSKNNTNKNNTINNNLDTLHDQDIIQLNTQNNIKSNNSNNTNSKSNDLNNNFYLQEFGSDIKVLNYYRSSSLNLSTKKLYQDINNINNINNKRDSTDTNTTLNNNQFQLTPVSSNNEITTTANITTNNNNNNNRNSLPAINRNPSFNKNVSPRSRSYILPYNNTPKSNIARKSILSFQSVTSSTTQNNQNNQNQYQYQYQYQNYPQQIQSPILNTQDDDYDLINKPFPLSKPFLFNTATNNKNTTTNNNKVDFKELNTTAGSQNFPLDKINTFKSIDYNSSLNKISFNNNSHTNLLKAQKHRSASDAILISSPTLRSNNTRHHSLYNNIRNISQYQDDIYSNDTPFNNISDNELSQSHHHHHHHHHHRKLKLLSVKSTKTSPSSASNSSLNLKYSANNSTTNSIANSQNNSCIHLHDYNRSNNPSIPTHQLNNLVHTFQSWLVPANTCDSSFSSHHRKNKSNNSRTDDERSVLSRVSISSDFSYKSHSSHTSKLILGNPNHVKRSSNIKIIERSKVDPLDKSSSLKSTADAQSISHSISSRNKRNSLFEAKFFLGNDSSSDLVMSSNSFAPTDTSNNYFNKSVSASREPSSLLPSPSIKIRRKLSKLKERSNSKKLSINTHITQESAFAISPYSQCSPSTRSSTSSPSSTNLLNKFVCGIKRVASTTKNSRNNFHNIQPTHETESKFIDYTYSDFNDDKIDFNTIKIKPMKPKIISNGNSANNSPISTIPYNDDFPYVIQPSASQSNNYFNIQPSATQSNSSSHSMKKRSSLLSFSGIQLSKSSRSRKNSYTFSSINNNRKQSSSSIKLPYNMGLNNHHQTVSIDSSFSKNSNTTNTSYSTNYNHIGLPSLIASSNTTNTVSSINSPLTSTTPLTSPVINVNARFTSYGSEENLSFSDLAQNRNLGLDISKRDQVQDNSISFFNDLIPNTNSDKFETSKYIDYGSKYFNKNKSASSENRSPGITKISTATDLITLSNESPQKKKLDLLTELQNCIEQMNLEDFAFEMTEKRISQSGWYSETNINDMRKRKLATHNKWLSKINILKDKIDHISLVINKMTDDESYSDIKFEDINSDMDFPRTSFSIDL